MKVEVMKYLNNKGFFRILKEERNFELQVVLKGLTRSEAVELIQKWKEDASKVEGPPATP